jgi:alcohol dehydrogenase
MLPYVLEYNYPGNIDKFSQIAFAMGEEETEYPNRAQAARAAKAVFELGGDIGIPQTLQDLNVPEEAIPDMSTAAMKVERPILNNPRTMSVKVAEDIYRNAFHGNRSLPSC